MAIDLAALAAKYGIDPTAVADVPTVAEVKAVKAEESRTSIDAGTLLLQSLHSAHPLALLTCKGCSRSFQSNYCKEWYCSDACMKKAFKKHFTVDWDTLKPGNHDFPQEASKVVGPDTTEALYEWCRAFVEAYENPRTSRQTDLSVERSETSHDLQERDQAPDYILGPVTSEDVHPTTDLPTEEHYPEANLPQPHEEPGDPFGGLF